MWHSLVFGIVGSLCTLLLSGCDPAPSAAEGRALYDASGCASCHGSFGRGDGPMATQLPAPPVDLRATSLFKRGSSETAIARTLAEGISIVHTIPALHHTHHELLMPKFDHLTETERRSIARYILSLNNKPDPGRVQP